MQNFSYKIKYTQSGGYLLFKRFDLKMILNYNHAIKRKEIFFRIIFV